jgi:serine protease Do
MGGRRQSEAFLVAVLIVGSATLLVTAALTMIGSKVPIEITSGPSMARLEQEGRVNAPKSASPVGLDVDLPLSERFARAAERVQPAVVNVSTERVLGPAEQELEMMERFFEQFFGQMVPGQSRRSLGSGVIVDETGLIVTNYHVIQQASEIKVQLASTATADYEAELVGVDPLTDLAVIRIEDTKDLPAVEMGDSDELRIGDWVLAIGNPFGVGQTVTAGIVSATSREIGQGPYDDFIQTDAAINPGNSGGPLVNLEGEVIGINSNIVSGTGGNIGIGFAIPSNLTRRIYDDLIEHGGVTRGWLGISMQELTPALAEGFGLPKPRGVLVAQVVGEDSPAGEAGLEAGDVIVRFAGETIDSLRELGAVVADTAPGESVSVELYRDGKLERTNVTLSERDVAGATPRAIPGSDEGGGHGRLGVRAQTLTPRGSAQMGLSHRPGVVVENVVPNGPAAKAGLQRGDIIREADRQIVESVEELADILSAAGEEAKLLLLVERIQGGESRQTWVVVEVSTP